MGIAACARILPLEGFKGAKELACTNGSEKQSGAPQQGWVALNSGTDDVVNRAIRALNLAPSIPIDDVGAFCASPPPTPVDITAGDWFNPGSLINKLTANAKAVKWSEWCQCKSSTPSNTNCSYTGFGISLEGTQTGAPEGAYTGKAVLATTKFPGVYPFANSYPVYIIETSPGQYATNGGYVAMIFPASIVESCPDGGTHLPPGETGEPPTPPEPPTYPPELPPPPPEPPLNPTDKQDLLDAIQQCYCNPSDGSEPVDLSEVIQILTQIRDETIPDAKEDIFEKIKDTVPEFLMVKVNITTVPFSATTRINPHGQRRVNGGWVMFKQGETSFPREFINFEKGIFVSPVPGEDVDYEYFLEVGYVADFTTSKIKFDKEAEVE